MGHATHFLERVARLDVRQADLALSLYRDSDLLRGMLHRAQLPADSQTVALALTVEPDSPHLLVSREGAFITCLAAGMKLFGAHRLPWPRVEALCKLVEGGRERLAAARAAVEREAGMRGIFSALLASASQLSREQMGAALTIAPFWERHLPDLLGDLSKDLFAHRAAVLAEKGGERWARSAEGTARLKMVWQLGWAQAHCAVLMGAGAAHRDPSLVPSTAALLDALSCILSATANAAIVIHAIWAVGQLGLPAYERVEASWREAESGPDLWLAPLKLAVLANRHPECRARAEDALSRLPSPARCDPEWREVILDVGENLRRMLLRAIVEREGVAEESTLFGKQAAWTIVRARGAPGWSSYEHVPDQLARTVVTLIEEDPLTDLRGVAAIAGCAPWLGETRAEDLYLPADQLSRFESPWSADAAVNALRVMQRWDAPRTPTVRATPRRGRNDPCGCGSGKKFKRCCAA